MYTLEYKDLSELELGGWVEYILSHMPVYFKGEFWIWLKNQSSWSENSANTYRENYPGDP